MVDRQQLISILNETRRANGQPDYTAAEIALMDEVLREQDLGVEVDEAEAPVARPVPDAVVAPAPDAPVDDSGWAIPGFTPGGPPLKKTVIPEGGFPVAVPPEYARQNAAPQAPVQQAAAQPAAAQHAPTQPAQSQQGQSQQGQASQGANAPQQPAPAEPDSSLPAPHPAFAARFTADFYLDQADEFAPFGSDEASDSVAELLQVRRRIVPTTNLRPLVAVALEEAPATVFEDMDVDEEHVNTIVIGVGFLLILLTGRIDDEGRRQVIAALERQEQVYGEDTSTFRTMLADLRAF